MAGVTAQRTAMMVIVSAPVLLTCISVPLSALNHKYPSSPADLQ